MRRIVLDTNTVVSALILPRSVSRRAFDHAFATGQVLASEATLEELDSVLRRPKFEHYVIEDERMRFLEMAIREVLLIEITVTLDDCRDQKDNKFLELAVSGQAQYIISGDRDLLDLSPYSSIEILSPRDFLTADATVSNQQGVLDEETS